VCAHCVRPLYGLQVLEKAEDRRFSALLEAVRHATAHTLHALARPLHALCTPSARPRTPSARPLHALCTPSARPLHALYTARRPLFSLTAVLHCVRCTAVLQVRHAESRWDACETEISTLRNALAEVDHQRSRTHAHLRTPIAYAQCTLLTDGAAALCCTVSVHQVEGKLATAEAIREAEQEADEEGDMERERPTSLYCLCLEQVMPCSTSLTLTLSLILSIRLEQVM
jgi:hypothetical protein